MTAAVTTQESPAASTKPPAEAVNTAPPAETETSNSGPSIPPYLQAVEQMVSTMGTMMDSYISYANQNTVATMAESNANTSNAIANLANVNSEMVQADQQEQKEQDWGVVGSVCADVLGVCLLPFDPALGLSMLGASASGQLHITQDVVGWISDGIQDVLPDLSSADCTALADVALVVTVVVAAVVLGVLTAGAADAAIAEVVVDDVAKDVVGDVADDVAKNVVGDISENVVGDVLGDATVDTIDDVGSSAVKDIGATAADSTKSGGSNAAKRGLKFGKMLGAQAMMQTDLLPNIVKAAASNSADPDSQTWKYIEAAAFGVEIILSIGLSISAATTKAPSSIDLKPSQAMQTSTFNGTRDKAMSLGFSEDTANSIGKGVTKTISNLPAYARNAALGAGIAEAISDVISGSYSAEVAKNQWEMSSEVEDASLEKVGTELMNSSNEMIQKAESKAEQELFDHNFGSFTDGGGSVSEAMA